MFVLSNAPGRLRPWIGRKETTDSKDKLSIKGPSFRCIAPLCDDSAGWASAAATFVWNGGESSAPLSLGTAEASVVMQRQSLLD